MPDSGYVLDPSICYEEAYLIPQHFSPALDGATLLREGIPFFRSFGPGTLKAAAAEGCSLEQEMWHVLADAMGVLEGQRKILLMYHGVVGWSVELLNDYTERWLPQHPPPRNAASGFSVQFPVFLREKYGDEATREVVYAVYSCLAIVSALLCARKHAGLLSHCRCVTPDDTAYDLLSMNKLLCLSFDVEQYFSSVFTDFAVAQKSGRKSGKKPTPSIVAKPLQVFIDLLNDREAPAYCAASSALFLACYIVGPDLSEIGARAAGVSDPWATAEGIAFLDAVGRVAPAGFSSLSGLSGPARLALVRSITDALEPERLADMVLLEMKEMEARGFEWLGPSVVRARAKGSKHPNARAVALAAILDGCLFAEPAEPAELPEPPEPPELPSNSVGRAESSVPSLDTPRPFVDKMEQFGENYPDSLTPPKSLFNKLYAAQFATLGITQVPVVFVGNPYKFTRCAQALCKLGKILDRAFFRPAELVRVPLLSMFSHASRSSYAFPEKVVAEYFFAVVSVQRRTLKFYALSKSAEEGGEEAAHAQTNTQASMANPTDMLDLPATPDRLTADSALAFAHSLLGQEGAVALRSFSSAVRHALLAPTKMENFVFGYISVEATSFLRETSRKLLMANRERQARILRRGFLLRASRWMSLAWDVHKRVTGAQKPGSAPPIRPIFMLGTSLVVSFWVLEFVLAPMLRLVGQSSTHTSNWAFFPEILARSGEPRPMTRVLSPDWLFHCYVAASLAEQSAEIYALVTGAAGGESKGAGEAVETSEAPGPLKTPKSATPSQDANAAATARASQIPTVEEATLAYLQLRAAAWRRAGLSQLAALLFLLGSRRGAREASNGPVDPHIEGSRKSVPETPSVETSSPTDKPLSGELEDFLSSHRLNEMAMYKAVHLADLCIFDYWPAGQRRSHFVDRLIERIKRDAGVLLSRENPLSGLAPLQVGSDSPQTVPCDFPCQFLAGEHAEALLDMVMEFSKKAAGRGDPENIFIPPLGADADFPAELSSYARACREAHLSCSQPPTWVARGWGMEHYTSVP